MICDNLRINEKNELEFAGRSTIALAKKYGTPLYVMDEEKIRSNIRRYKNTIREACGEEAMIYFASKACDFKDIYRIVKEEGIGADVVSGGEIFTAYSAGFPMELACFHGNNKTEEEIHYAMDVNVGCFVVDNEEEVLEVERIANEKNRIQKVLLRITPGIDPHTYEAVATGKVDSKFGSAIETGAAEKIVKLVLKQPHLSLAGFHCHVGSQVFDSDVFLKCAEAMLKFMAEMKSKVNYEAHELNLGGGYGVRYVDSDPMMNLEENLRLVGRFIRTRSEELNLKMPIVKMEPGRSIVADAGMTLYTVGSVKCIPGYKNYVSIDGGMSDNPRFALYRSKYTVLCANKVKEDQYMDCSVVGKCCESGDIIQENVPLPKSIQRKDLIAVLTTGAYNYSMASNYNRITRPAVVMLKKEDEEVVVQRESWQDLIKNEK